MKDAAKTSHEFKIQLKEVPMSAEQADRIVSAIRKATTQELLKMDFRIEELKSITRNCVAGPCGSACRS